MDDYERFMMDFEISPMPENFKSAQGKRVLCNGCGHMALRAVRGSFVQINLAVKMPVKSILLLEECPAFPYRYPVETVTVLRAALGAIGLSGTLHAIGQVEDDDGIRKGDMVLDDGSVELRAYQSTQLTAFIPISADQKPGEYKGSIRFYAHSMLYDGRLAKEITFTIRVEDIVLPSPGQGSFYLNLWQHIFNIARKCEVRAYTQAHIEALRPYQGRWGNLATRPLPCC